MTENEITIICQSKGSVRINLIEIKTDRAYPYKLTQVNLILDEFAYFSDAYKSLLKKAFSSKIIFNKSLEGVWNEKSIE